MTWNTMPYQKARMFMNTVCIIGALDGGVLILRVDCKKAQCRMSCRMSLRPKLPHVALSILGV